MIRQRQDILQADARSLPLADASVHCVVTSPPYFGLRCYGMDGQIGLEPTPEAYISEMVRVFREVKRVLRDDGTLWLNIGDSYSASGWECRRVNKIGNVSMASELRRSGKKRIDGLKTKDLIGIPWLLAFALRADGWYLRQDIIWHKLNPMPESVTDRCTKSHEYIFLMTKKPRYFYDADALREPLLTKPHTRGGRHEPLGGPMDRGGHSQYDAVHQARVFGNSLGRNKRDVWTMSTQAVKEAHFATYPLKLPLTCIKAGTSERGCCPTCGAAWKRIVKASGGTIGKSWHDHSADKSLGMSQYDPSTQKGGVGKAIDSNGQPYKREMTGWTPTCKCPDHEPVPCVVLDPFHGAGTTAIAAEMLGRSYVGIELKREYIDLSLARIAKHREKRKHRTPAKKRKPRCTRTGMLFPMESA